MCEPYDQPLRSCRNVYACVRGAQRAEIKATAHGPILPRVWVRTARELRTSLRF